MRLRPRIPGVLALVAVYGFAGAAQAVPTVGIGAATMIEGIAGNIHKESVPLTLSEPASADVKITFHTEPMTATASRDFHTTSTSVTIPAGQTLVRFSIRIKGDNVYEPTETFRFVIDRITTTDASVVLESPRRIFRIFDDDIPPEALTGSVGQGDGVEKVEATATDPFDLTGFLEAAGYRNSTTLGGPEVGNIALDLNGRPTTGRERKLLRGTFAPPRNWPPPSATDATRLRVPAAMLTTAYSGAFEPGVPRVRHWDQGWTVGVNGNADVWRFFADAPGTALSGKAAPNADGSCPAGTIATGTLESRFGPLSNDETGLFDGVAGDYDVCRLPRRITSDLTLTNDNVYEIAAAFPGTYVGDGEGLRSDVPAPVHVTLAVEAGTLIIGRAGKGLVITRGSTIDAVGTASAPIVFTSETQVQSRFDGTLVTPAETDWGEWTGLAITGNARDDGCADADFAHCDRALADDVGHYGGNDDDDSSGVLRYVVVRHAGNATAGDDNALGCLTLAGVGRATKLSYLQCHKSAGDGVQILGGSAFLFNVVLSGNLDDSVDYDGGWTGGAQFVYIVQSDSLGAGLGRALEAGTSIGSGLPIVTFPLLANFTAVGPGNRSEGGTIDDGQAVLFRGGVRGQLWNSVFTGDQPKGCLDLDDPQTFDRALEEGGTATAPGRHLFIRNTLFDCSAFSTVING